MSDLKPEYESWFVDSVNAYLFEVVELVAVTENVEMLFTLPVRRVDWALGLTKGGRMNPATSRHVIVIKIRKTQFGCLVFIVGGVAL